MHQSTLSYIYLNCFNLSKKLDTFGLISIKYLIANLEYMYLIQYVKTTSQVKSYLKKKTIYLCSL